MTVNIANHSDKKCLVTTQSWACADTCSHFQKEPPAAPSGAVDGVCGPVLSAQCPHPGCEFEAVHKVLNDHILVSERLCLCKLCVCMWVCGCWCGWVGVCLVCGGYVGGWAGVCVGGWVGVFMCVCSCVGVCVWGVGGWVCSCGCVRVCGYVCVWAVGGWVCSCVFVWGVLGVGVFVCVGACVGGCGCGGCLCMCVCAPCMYA